MVKNSVLIVVDMQKGFLKEHSSHILPNVVELVGECCARGIPVVFSKFVNRPESQFEKLLKWQEVSSAPDTDILDELDHFDRIEISKNYYSAITPAMKELISAYDWRTIFICGISTESCVLKTAIDTFELNLRPIVVSDACASDVSEEAHNAGLHVLEIMIGSTQVLSTTELWSVLK